MQLGSAGVPDRVEYGFAQGKVKLSLHRRGQVTGADIAFEIKLESGACSKNFQLLFEPPLQRAGLDLFGQLVLRQQVANLGNGSVDVVFYRWKCAFERAAVADVLAAATLGPHADARQQLQDPIVQFAGNALPFFSHRGFLFRLLVFHNAEEAPGERARLMDLTRASIRFGAVSTSKGVFA